MWNPRGSELFYTEPGGSLGTSDPSRGFRLMAVPMTDPARPGRPQRLFEAPYGVLPLDGCASTACYSVSPDGESFYTLQLRQRDVPRVTSLRLILNWFEDVRRLAPTN